MKKTFFASIDTKTLEVKFLDESKITHHNNENIDVYFFGKFYKEDDKKCFFYERWEDLNYKLKYNGEYVFFGINKKTREVFLGRDWAGVENIYYSMEGCDLLISNSVYSIIKNKKTRRFNVESCAQFIIYEYYSEPNTLFEEVYSVVRGGGVVFDYKKRCKIFGSSEYKKLDFNEFNYIKDVRCVIAHAHQERLGSKNGIYLSGGIDSTVMAVTLKKDLGINDLISLSFRTKNAEQDETDDAKKVAKQLNIDFESVLVDPEIEFDLESAIEWSPFPYTGMVMINAMANKLKNIGLSGVNMYAGQDSRIMTPPYKKIDELILLNLKEHQKTRNILSATAKVFAKISNNKKINNQLNKLQNAHNIHSYIQGSFFHAHDNDTIGNSIGGVLAKNNLINEIKSIIDVDASNEAIFNNIVKIAWDRQHTADISYMVGSTRANGNYCSVPFFDINVASVAASIPFELRNKKSKGRAGHGMKEKMVNKYVIREAYKNDLTNDMIYRDKAVCITNHLYMNGCFSGYVDKYFAKPAFMDTNAGGSLNIKGLFERGLKNNRKWKITDYEAVVENHNILFLEIIARKFNIS